MRLWVYTPKAFLLLRKDREQGVNLLSKAIMLAPLERRFVDEYYFHVHKKVNKESKLDSDVSDHVILHQILIKTFSDVLKVHPNANYVRLKLVDSYLALDKPEQAKDLISDKNLIEDDSLILAKIRVYRVINHPDYDLQFRKILDSEEYSKNILLNLTALRYLMEQNPVLHAESLIDHFKAIIHSLPKAKKALPRDITYSLIDAILFGSDIGETSRSQSMEPLDYGNELAQWSLLAGILIKLDMNEEAYLVIKHRVLPADLQIGELY